jgi:hypothetical protein
LEKIELTEDDISYLTKELKTRNVYKIFWIIVLLLLFYGFYTLNFTNKSSDIIDRFAIVLELIALGMLTYMLTKGIERDINLKRNLLNQQKIIGYFTVIEKEITNKNDSDDWSHYVIKMFSEIENKNKYIFLNATDYRRISIDDSIYIEYFTDSNIIKILNYKNRKLEYLRYQIYDSTWG